MAQRKDPDPSEFDIRSERLRLSTPAQILAAVPYLLGFQPEHSGVLICIRRRLVGLTMRFDLDLPPQTLAETMTSRLAGEGADAAVLVLYDPPEPGRRGAKPERRPGQDLVTDLLGVITEADVRVQDSLGVRERRFWSYLCRDRRCCPPHGHPVPQSSDDEVSRVAAGFVAAGVAPMRSRDALRASVEPGPAADSVAVGQAVLASAGRPASERLRRWRLAVDRHRLGPLRPGGGATAAEAAVLVSDVFVTEVRDAVILWCADAEQREAVIGVCLELAPLAPPPFHTQLLAVLAWAAHAAGEGALAGVALERALRTDPGHSMSRLLLAGLHGGIRPEQMKQLSYEAAGLIGSTDAS